MGFALMMELLSVLGFVVNLSKCSAPHTIQTFLGVCLDSDSLGMGDVVMFFAADRLSRLAARTAEMESFNHPVRVSMIMSLMGTWAFIAHVVPGVAPYLRSGFTCITGKEKRGFTYVPRGFRLDLAFIRRLISGPSPRVSVTRRPLTQGFAAWDASTHWGMGGYLDGTYFSISWADLAAGMHGPVEAIFPFRDIPTSHINYLELFAGYWFIKLWGARLRGHSLVCRTDSTATEGMLKRLWGKAPFIPLLKRIFTLLVRYDLSLDVHFIGTKDNLLADLLSRGRMVAFHAASALYKTGLGYIADQEDWQLMQHVFATFDHLYGPFMIDACVDEFRRNSHCARSWTAHDDCMKQQWHGLTVFCNGPFSMLLAIIMHFLKCKMEEPVGTAALFIVPVWVGEAYLALIYSRPDVFTVVARFPKGSALFTAPVPTHLGGGRRYAGPTRWPVIAVWAGPEAPRV
jgi:hypothetical protein